MPDTPCSPSKFAAAASICDHDRVTSGLRERKKLATRLALHEAALQLVAERGLDHVSVDDIAERADVSPRTFFNYFSSKDDAVLGLDPDGAAQQVEAFLARPADESPVQALRAVARAQAAEMAEDTELWPLRMTVIDATRRCSRGWPPSFGEGERVLAEAIARAPAPGSGSTPIPRCWPASPARDAHRPAPLAGQRLHRRTPRPRRRGLGRCWPPGCRHPA